MITGNLISSSKIGLLPILRVSAPTLSTIDIYYNSIIIASYILVGEETTHDFEVYKTGTYTVTSTRGTETNSKNVLVKMACIYEVKIAYSVIIYNNGVWDSEWNIGRLSVSISGSYKASPTLTDTGSALSCSIPATATSYSNSLYLNIDKDASIDFSLYKSYTIKYVNRYLANTIIYTWVCSKCTYSRQSYSAFSYSGTETADISGVNTVGNIRFSYGASYNSRSAQTSCTVSYISLTA